jgi:hypothetical protein
MRKSLLVRQILPSLFFYALLIVSAIGADFLLHRVGLYWVGRYLGIVGSVLILASFAYSLRKRKIVQSGSPKRLLELHESLSWVGVLMILVHAGAHFNALLPWLATGAMLVVVASGFTGKYLLKEARERIRSRAEGEPESRVFLDALTVDVMARWRAVHMPITALFATLAVLHIFSILVFWGW